jgi:hypothetical protein
MNYVLPVHHNVQIINILMMLVVTVALTIVLFEVIPERGVCSIPEGIQEADEHIITIPAYSGVLHHHVCKNNVRSNIVTTKRES